MRIPADMPRPPRVRSRRGRTTLIIAGVILFFIATSLKGIAGFYVDYLWFNSLGHSEVWSGVLGAKIALALIFMGAFFVIMWVNLLLADRFAPKFRPAGPEEEMIERFEELVGQRVGLLRIVVSLLFAVIAGAGASSEWKSWILFTHGGSFGIKDPQFHTDIGFYVFKLPFLSFVTGWLFAALLIVLIVTTVAHYLNGGIRVQAPGPRVTSAVKGHLSVLLGLLALVRAAEYVLERYQLTLSTRGTVDGATYTDTHAQLPAIQLLLLISIASCALFIVNIFRRGWVLPMLGVGLWALVALIAGGIYPQFVQRVQVKPNESAKETPYISRNIAATRAAIGISEVASEDYSPQTDRAKVDLRDEVDTVRNIRLWDPNRAITEKTFQQEQAIRDFYKINDIDVDRYDIDGKLTQVVLGARDLDSDHIPQKSWEARHITYTHGQGVVLAPAGAKAENDSPDYLVSDVPVTTTTKSLELTQPDVYFGEGLDGYIITGTTWQELDYRAEDKSVFSDYKGKDGVGVGSLFRRLSFGVAFGDVNPVISDFISSKSKIHYIRDVRKRVQHLAPFLDFDADPYTVLHDGRLVYIVDAYTTTDRYPYAQRADSEQLPDGSTLNHRFNYVRNSVKAVVDAYDGTVDFYVMPVDDPIIEAYRQAFPGLFKDYKDMPSDLKDHLRYPEDLFTVQTNMWARYHLSDPQDFFNRNDGWTVSLDPGTTRAASAPSTTNANTPITSLEPARGQRIEPYYLLLQLPGSRDLQFVITRPFSPFSQEDDKPQLTALMFGETDTTETGKLRVLVMPSKRLPDGPTQANSHINSYEPVSRTRTLLGGNGSSVLFGNLLVLPIQDSLLYVRPFYVESSDTQIPSLRKVIVVFEGDVQMADTLDQALAAMFGTDDVVTETPPSSDGGGEGSGVDKSLTVDQQVAQLLNEASQLQVDANAALKRGDLGTYQKKNQASAKKVDQAIELLTSKPSGEGGSTSTTAPPNSGGSTTTTSSTTTTTQPDSA